ncbi:MAG: DUF99 family protein [Salinigranum sp.]
MKAGVRALGVAESYAGVDTAGDESVLCGAVVRADRVVEDFAFGTCAVGGEDATAAIDGIVSTLGREDVRYLLVAGIAPAWFNVVDLRALARTTGRPALSVSFESSPGLEPALREQFSGGALRSRLDVYRAQPPRREVDLGGETLYVRAVGLDDDEAADAVRAFTPEGGRPEPLRVARAAARAARRWRDSGPDG